MTRRTAVRSLSVAAAAGLAAAQNPASEKKKRWVLRYFYDRDDESYLMNDFCFTSERFGIAVGQVIQKGGRVKPMALVTRDGGTKWDSEPLPELGVSLFFLTDSLGWLVTDKAIWRTEESGRDWKKLKNLKGINRVYFRDENRGWAIGRQKTILETRDGGRTWTEVEEAQKPSTTPEYTSYNWIEWQNRKSGIIVGAGVPPRRDESDKPAWLDPQAAAKRRQWPAMTIALDTQNGGETWKSQTVPAFGLTTRFRATAAGFGLALIRFTDSFEYPSELYLSRPGGGNDRVFREKNRMVTDCGWWAPTRALIAAIEPPGRLHQLPIPGKLHMLFSNNLTTTNRTEWTEMAVDYRAFGNRATLSIVDELNVWVATDAGQFLKFEL